MGQSYKTHKISISRQRKHIPVHNFGKISNEKKQKQRKNEEEKERWKILSKNTLGKSFKTFYTLERWEKYGKCSSGTKNKFNLKIF